MLNKNALTTVEFIKKLTGLSELDENQIFIIETFINERILNNQSD